MPKRWRTQREKCAVLEKPQSSAMSMTRMRMKQMERSGVPLFFSHEGQDFAKLPQNGIFWD